MKKEMTLEELQAGIEATKQKRQHGRTGKVLADPEAEAKRLYNNLKSREARKRVRDLDKARDRAYTAAMGRCVDENEEDEHGIKPVDRRRYKQTFFSGYEGQPVYLSYVKMMTGLKNKQILVLQDEEFVVNKFTGEKRKLVPVPAVTSKDVKAEEDAE